MLHPFMTEALARQRPERLRADAQERALARQANGHTSKRETRVALAAALLSLARRAASTRRTVATTPPPNNHMIDAVGPARRLQ
jgi:hypothetical protein